MALLDYKVSTGYDFDQKHEEDDERRVADTFRVISLSFSNLGGPDVVQEYFAENGRRSYEDRVYGNLGEYYLAKLRYDDAAKTYKAFVALYPFHRASPHFSMRVVEIFTEGEFPKLVLESKQEFAATYGLQAEYWRHFDVEQSPEVLSYLKTNLNDLASHYHAQYQNRGARRREARELSRGAALVPRLPRLVPDGSRLAADQLPARGPAARERGFRRGGKASTSARPTTIPRTPSRRPPATPRSTRTGRTSRAPPKRCRTRRARHRRELAQVRGRLPDARAGPGGARRGRRRPVRDEGLPAGDRGGAAADRSLSGRRAGPAPLGLDGRCARVVRARRVPAGRAGLRPGARADAAGRQGAPGAGRQPRRLDLQAGRAGERRPGLSRGRRPLPAGQAGGADVADPRGGGVRRRRGAHPAAGLDGGGRRARSVPQQLARSRAQSRGDQADRIRLPAERPAVPRRRRIRARRLGVGRPGTAGRGAARRGRPLRAVRIERAGARRLHPLRRAVSAAGRHRHRDALQDRRDFTRRRTTSRATSRSWHRSCASTRKPAPSAPAARGRSRRARRWSFPSGSTASSRASSCDSRSRRASRRRSGAWMPRSRRSSA